MSSVVSSAGKLTIANTHDKEKGPSHAPLSRRQQVISSNDPMSVTQAGIRGSTPFPMQICHGQVHHVIVAPFSAVYQLRYNN